MASKLRKAIRNPDEIPPFVRRKFGELCISAPGFAYLRLRYGDTVDHLSEDWDNLVILDACRHDTFAEMADFDGDLEWRLSPASATAYWLKNVVEGRTFHDTVYVSANPRVSRYEENFHAVDHVWNWGWDDELKITPPDPVVEAAIQAYHKYPNKRIVVHFMQPHQPYIGEFGRNNIDNITGEQRGRERALGEDVNDEEWTNALDEFEQGNISSEQMFRAYRENLELVLPHVRTLINEFDEKTVVSSDHGELFAERGWPYPRRTYGHPGRVPAFKLRQVPWLTVEGEHRKELVAEDPKASEEFDDSHVEDRLRHLGYLDG